jgi:hypothetical protein
MDNNIKILAGVIGVAAVGTVATSAVILNNGTAKVSTTPTSTLNANSTSTASNSSDQYKNGTYSATVSYDAHRHQESITVSLTIENGKITSVSDSHSGNDHESVMYQNSFEDNINSYTVGKNLNDVALSRVGGASDTTTAFMNALTQIKADARQ